MVRVCGGAPKLSDLVLYPGKFITCRRASGDMMASHISALLCDGYYIPVRFGAIKKSVRPDPLRVIHLFVPVLSNLRGFQMKCVSTVEKDSHE